MSTPMMRSVRQHSLGDADVLVVEEVARPEPYPTEVLVRVHAAGINPVDWQTRSGGGMAGVFGDETLLGWDVAGVVEEVGFGVTVLSVGDEVYGMPWFPRPAAAYSDYVTAPARQFARKPASMSFVEAAAVPLAALTAWQALVDTARVSAGQRILVNVAAGGVGHFAVQIAKHLGAHVVAVASGRHRDWLTALGADEVVDYTAGPFEDAVSGIDVVLDLRGEDADNTSSRALRVVRRGGLLVSVPDGVSPALAAAAAARDVRTSEFLVEPDGHALAEIGALIEAGALKVEVQQVYPLADVVAAHRDGEKGRTRGKLVLSMT